MVAALRASGKNLNLHGLPEGVEDLRSFSSYPQGFTFARADPVFMPAAAILRDPSS